MTAPTAPTAPAATTAAAPHTAAAPAPTTPTSPEPAPTTTALLEVRDVAKRFGGVQALTGTNLLAQPNRITSLIGPNGAGKTTLFNIISGLEAPTSGAVFFKGHRVNHLSVTKRSRMGIARTFQKLEAFNSLSARDNIKVAAEQRRLRDQLGRGRWHSPDAIADDLLEQLGLGDVADITVGTLPTGTARLVELARALAMGPSLLLLDEPSSGLNEEETEAVAELLRDIVSDKLGILLVEHDMNIVMSVSSEIYVLDFGLIIAHGDPQSIQSDAKVRAAYLGSH